MAIDKLAFTPTDGWANSTTFKTDPDSESDARAALQLLHDQTKNYINNLLDDFESTLAEELGFTTIEGLTATKVRAALLELLTKFTNYVPTTSVETTLSSSNAKIPTSKAVSDAMVAGGLGDMLSSVYVTEGGSGKVLAAVDSDKLGGTAASDIPTKTEMETAIGEAIPTVVSELENDSNFQADTGSVAMWNGLHIFKPTSTTFLCTKAQYDADASNPNRATTLYIGSESLE